MRKFAILGSLLLCAPVAFGQVASVRDPVVRVAADTQQVSFSLTLPLRNKPELDQLVAQLYNPTSPQFRHFLTPAEFNARFAPTEADYTKLKARALSAGLKVTGEHSGRTLLNVSGDVATVRNLFSTQMQWRQGRNGKQYLATASEPLQPALLTDLGSNAVALTQKPATSLAHSAALPGGHPTAAPQAAADFNGPFTPAEIKGAYDLNSIQNGGELVGLIEFSGPNNVTVYNDAGIYASSYGLNHPSIALDFIDGGNSETDGGNGSSPLEVALDVDMVMLASNPAEIMIFNAPNSYPQILDTYTYIADLGTVQHISTSWAIDEPDLGQSNAGAEGTQFEKMAAEGIAVFASSGDGGAIPCAAEPIGYCVNDPAAQPYVTGVGGTVLTLDSSLQYESEVAWSDSGGGLSEFSYAPQYQPVEQYYCDPSSSCLRQVPDVSLNAGNPYYVYCSLCGGWNGAIGTSASAPIWAAFWSLVSKGLGSPAGLASPTIYTAAAGDYFRGPYQGAIIDITSGDNGFFQAGPGYDPVTGIGTFDGANLYNAALSILR